MKRKPIMAGNWKMYKNRDEALAFIYQINEKLPSSELVETVVCAPAVYLRDLVKRQGDNLRVGAQNMHYLDEGAYTGEISAGMIKNIGVEYVVLGHSERRAYYNETDETVNLKTKKAIESDIVPIVCVGEELSIRENGTTDKVVGEQVVKAYKDISKEDALKTVIAYEPIWAIGTGKTATPQQANETIVAIRKVVEGLYGKDVADRIRILYGGSVKPENVVELLSTSDIDGALVGGASLKPESFLALAEAASKK
ncbi:triose-phosphate isomerase [Haploplasma axanthum]|uniref:Triosephosphate isomerase n=1 Tax=Haploplasma axanthum TaxID=29552 RepID=A0A449BDF8_HAPAX|nr:triose-phosphate isomerase [Haploplasma axanthum]VEU80340.1 Triosephosphate isomerase [Haploplasma axanthum]